MATLEARPGGALRGRIDVPGDKSISHRALMIGAAALGRTTVTGLLEAEDVLRTAGALRALGAGVEKTGDVWVVDGVGVGGFTSPDDIVDLGNSGTAARLLLGLMATHDLTAHLTGDHSLRSRPMDRVIGPLSRMGAAFDARDGGRMPLVVRGAAEPVPIEYDVPVPSAQVKSAVLFAALNTPGRTTVTEREATRDHTENMLRAFGADIDVRAGGDGGRVISVAGYAELTARDVTVPGDPSSAAFPGVAALLVPGSEVTINNVGVNPLRAGLFDTLRDMGADLEIANLRDASGEPVADITFRHGPLTGADIPAARGAGHDRRISGRGGRRGGGGGRNPFPRSRRIAGKGKRPVRGHRRRADRLRRRYPGRRRRYRRVGVWRVAARRRGNTGQSGSPDRDGVSGAGTCRGKSGRDRRRGGDRHQFPRFRRPDDGAGRDLRRRRRVSRPVVIAVDGPAASGKGTLARRMASALGYAYLDTGVLYRAVGLALLRSGDDPRDDAAAVRAARGLDAAAIDFSDPDLRNEDTGQAAGIVAANPDVRAALTALQRNFASAPPDGAPGAVLDGRDIGTVICPDADYKFFIDADVEVRAARRVKELQEKGDPSIPSRVLQDMRERDHRDRTRAVAPLAPAADASVIDTTNLNADAAFALAMSFIR